MHFFLKLVPARPTFSKDMTPDEGNHAAARRLLDRSNEAGKVHVFGPVLDPNGVYASAS
jgi:hypothetical protein